MLLDKLYSLPEFNDWTRTLEELKNEVETLKYSINDEDKTRHWERIESLAEKKKLQEMLGACEEPILALYENLVDKCIKLLGKETEYALTVRQSNE